MINPNIVCLLVFISCFSIAALADETLQKQGEIIQETNSNLNDGVNISSDFYIGKMHTISLKMQRGVIPVILGDRIIFLGKDYFLYSVSKQNLDKYYWKLDFSKYGKLYRASILYSQNMVIYAVDDNVYGIDADTGEIKWQKTLRSVIAGAPIVVHDSLIVVTIDNYLYSFNLSDGSLLWSGQESIPEVKSYYSFSRVSSGDIVVLSFSNGKIIAFNSTNGLKIWEISVSDSTNNNIAFVGGASLSASEQDVIVIDKFRNISSIDIQSGKKKWSKDLNIQGISGIKENYIVAIIDDKLISLDISTGEFLWQYDLLQYKKPKIQWNVPVIIDNNVLVMGSNGCVILVDSKSGALKSVNYILPSSYYVPIFLNSSVYIITSKDKVVIFDKKV
ncbi:quinoprotein [Ehrlichia ruminantium]|uniref:PQQ-binding-like beta-propeller repeat protein n=1 Tax=Ehrlichia ruminantium TaxID=779 RepID=UPI0015DC612F|nr:PQQ-binding-like beta-propeller repeat protein [Ehrlichia ruminantium]QLK58852.1 quinoprotein [Ehrlichia ruminantium]